MSAAAAAGGIFSSAMVLAAGYGTRMRPLTDAIPKPMVAVAGKTLLDRVLDGLAASGIARAVVNVHYLADRIEAHLREREGRPHVAISDERAAMLDTGGGVRKALPLLGPAPFIVHNSDSIWSERGTVNLDAMAAAWRPGIMSALLLLAPRDSSIGYDGAGDFALERRGRLRRRDRSKSAPFVFAGVSVLKPQLFSGIVEDKFSLNAVFDSAALEGKLFGCVLDGTWMHVGTPQALAEAESHLYDVESGSTDAYRTAGRA